MNYGIIAGVVENTRKAHVRLSEVYVGHVSNRLPVYHPTLGIEGNIPLAYTEDQGFFHILFRWNEADVGEFMGASFRVSGVDAIVAKSGFFFGTLRIVQNVFTYLTEFGTQDAALSGAAGLARMRLPGAVSTALSPRLGTSHKVAIGLAAISIR